MVIGSVLLVLGYLVTGVLWFPGYLIAGVGVIGLIWHGLRNRIVGSARTRNRTPTSWDFFVKGKAHRESPEAARDESDCDSKKRFRGNVYKGRGHRGLDIEPGRGEPVATHFQPGHAPQCRPDEPDVKIGPLLKAK